MRTEHNNEPTKNPSASRNNPATIDPWSDPGSTNQTGKQPETLAVIRFRSHHVHLKPTPSQVQPVTLQRSDTTIHSCVLRPSGLWVGPVCGLFPIRQPCWQLDQDLQTQHSHNTRRLGGVNPTNVILPTKRNIYSIWSNAKVVCLFQPIILRGCPKWASL